MAKKIIIPPRKTLKTQVKNIISKGPRTPSSPVITKGTAKSKVQQVLESRHSKPSQNQRGRIRSKDEKDLTR